MSKVGKNDPCPCGSGKKFKKCHDGNFSNKTFNLNTLLTPQNLYQKDIPEVASIGLPGFQSNIVYLVGYENPDDPRNEGGPEGMFGNYKLIFTLSRPGFHLKGENHIMPAESITGTSHLRLNPPNPIQENEIDEINLHVFDENRNQMNFIGYANKEGFLSKLVCESIQAKHFNDATLKGYEALMRILSGISTYHDVPINIYQIDTIELRTNNRKVSFFTPYRELQILKGSFNNLSEEFSKYSSLYQEAMNSNSPYYEFLCYYKIIEGLRERRNRLIAEAKARGEAISSSPKQIIPPSLKEQIIWLEELFPIKIIWDKMQLSSIFPKTSFGKKINEIIDKEIRPIRHKIAHGVLDDGEPTFSLSKGLDTEKVHEWLPLTKYIARFLMKKEFPDFFIK
jgi:hypothetical protein